ncbi:probable apyrase 6 [Cornus florida]|uniref:probable apyrase 6 n=1 Tax=Cornus florida TaxID=4283 RepID=UPI00289EC9A3|nr:probable apyrase 6 [Cornus florida]
MRRSNARTRDRKPNDDLDSIKLHHRPNSPDRSNDFPRNPKHNTTNVLVVFASIALTLAFLCYLFVYLNCYRNYGKRKFGIVIDGGSTGTRIHVFEYVIRGRVLDFDLGENGLASMRVIPGLSAYMDDPGGAGGSLVDLLEFGRKRIPKEHWGETEIRLMGTAGLRMLELGVQEQILESCRRVLRSSGFKFGDDWASVITGSDEGIYAWVVANYALGTLGQDPHQTTGIIELGGASAQVTFISSEPVPPEFSHIVKYGNITYNLYSHSLLHFGQNVAFDSFRESLVTRGIEFATESLQSGQFVNPCIPKGYSHDTKSWNLSPGSLAEKNWYLSTLHPGGNFSECRSAALMLLQKGTGAEKCSYQHCYIGSTFIPKLRGKFLATENFFHTLKFFGLSPKAYISDLMRAGQQFCEEDWSKLKIKYHSFDDEDLLRYCFSSAYIVALLHDSLGISLDDGSSIGFVNQVADIPLDWALGAFILQSTADLDVELPNWISYIVRDDSPSLLALCVILIALMFTAWSVSKWRKPQFKTIYDLDK